MAFGYDPAATRRIDRQRDRRGTWTCYEYDGAGKLASARVQLGAAADPRSIPRRGSRPRKGWAWRWRTRRARPPRRTGQVYTRIDGPRTDVIDHTVLWLSPTGVVRRVRDPLGGETYLQFDPRFPALATR